MLENNVPEGWSQMPLKEGLDRVVGGGTPSRTALDFWSGNIPWASVKDFKDEILTLNKTVEHISDTGLRNSASNLIDKGTVLVCTRMAVGRSAINTVPVAINQDIKALYTNERLNGKFLLYFLNHAQSKMESISIGSTVKGIQVKDLLSLVIMVPPLPEQRRIAEILDTLDETIRKTEALIDKLKQVKAGLLHDLLTRGIDEHGQLRNPATHPEQFKDSPLGRIPREWVICTIDSLTSHVGSGITPRGGSEVYKTEGIIFVRSQNVTFEGLKLGDVAYIDERTNEQMKRSEIYSNDVLLNITGASIGRCCVVPTWLGKANVNQHVCAIRLQKRNYEDARLLSLVLLSDIGQSQIDRLNAGGNREGLNYQQIRAFVVPWPSKEERKKISSMLDSQDTRIQKEQSYLNKLQQLKKGLMDDLLTGKVRVNQLEEVLA